jgi:hypothetical protein
MIKHYRIGDVGECKLNPSTYLIISAEISEYGLTCFMTHVVISNVLIGTIGSMGYQALKLDKSKKPNTKLNV